MPSRVKATARSIHSIAFTTSDPRDSSGSDPSRPSAACRLTDTAASEWASTSWISRAIRARSASAAAWFSAACARRACSSAASASWARST